MFDFELISIYDNLLQYIYVAFASDQRMPSEIVLSNSSKDYHLALIKCDLGRRFRLPTGIFVECSVCIVCLLLHRLESNISLAT